MQALATTDELARGRFFDHPIKTCADDFRKTQNSGSAQTLV
jgi:hypothetical protein